MITFGGQANRLLLGNTGVMVRRYALRYAAWEAAMLCALALTLPSFQLLNSIITLAVDLNLPPAPDARPLGFFLDVRLLVITGLVCVAAIISAGIGLAQISLLDRWAGRFVTDKLLRYQGWLALNTIGGIVAVSAAIVISLAGHTFPISEDIVASDVLWASSLRGYNSFLPPRPDDAMMLGTQLALFGFSIGFFQWLFLRRYILNVSWWILATTVSWGIAGIDAPIVSEHVRPIFGEIIGRAVAVPFEAVIGSIIRRDLPVALVLALILQGIPAMLLVHQFTLRPEVPLREGIPEQVSMTN